MNELIHIETMPNGWVKSTYRLGLRVWCVYSLSPTETQLLMGYRPKVRR